VQEGFESDEGGFVDDDSEPARSVITTEIGCLCEIQRRVQVWVPWRIRCTISRFVRIEICVLRGLEEEPLSPQDRA